MRLSFFYKRQNCAEGRPRRKALSPCTASSHREAGKGHTVNPRRPVAAVTWLCSWQVLNSQQDQHVLRVIPAKHMLQAAKAAADSLRAITPMILNRVTELQDRD